MAAPEAIGRCRRRRLHGQATARRPARQAVIFAARSGLHVARRHAADRRAGRTPSPRRSRSAVFERGAHQVGLDRRDDGRSVPTRSTLVDQTASSCRTGSGRRAATAPRTPRRPRNDSPSVISTRRPHRPSTSRPASGSRPRSGARSLVFANAWLRIDADTSTRSIGSCRRCRYFSHRRSAPSASGEDDGDAEPVERPGRGGSTPPVRPTHGEDRSQCFGNCRSAGNDVSESRVQRSSPTDESGE